jgi:glycerophosphoryl diester phosphodiesterase
MAAFELAIAHGCDGIELDVQLSRDQQLVVIHDETLQRTTAATGWVKDHTLAELQSLDASGGRPGFAGAGIPRLEELLELVSPTSLKLDIELKNSEIPYPGLEARVLDAVANAGLSDRVILSSFSEESVARMAKLSDIEVGLIFEPNQLLWAPWRRAAALGATALHPPRRRTSAHLVKRCHALGLNVRVWTANSPAPIRRLIRLGVDGIFTDDPRTALAFRSQAQLEAELSR